MFVFPPSLLLPYPFRCALPPPLRRPPQLTMYSTAGMKFSRRWRRMAWRLNTTTFGAFVVSTLVSLAAVRAMVSSAGPKDSRALPTQTPAAASRALHARGRVRASRGRLLCLEAAHARAAAPRPSPRARPPADRARVEANGSYARRRYAESGDNPL